MSTWTAEQRRGDPGLPGYRHGLWALVRALLGVWLLGVLAAITLGNLLARAGLSVGLDTSHGWRNAGAWLLGTDNPWFVLTNLAASATVTLLCARLLQVFCRSEQAMLPFSSALESAFGALAIGTLAVEPGARGWILTTLVVAAGVRPVALRDAPAPLARRTRRRLLLAGAAAWLVLLAGCFVADNLQPLGQERGMSGSIDGGGLVRGRDVGGRLVYPYRAGRRTEWLAYAANRSFTRALTVVAVEPRAGLTRAPWRLRLVPAEGVWPAGRAPAVRVRIPALGERTLTVEARFSGCTPSMSWQTFTLRSLPFRLSGGGSGRVGLSKPVSTTCP